MDNLEAQVSRIRNELASSDQTLRRLEEHAVGNINRELGHMRDALRNTDKRICAVSDHIVMFSPAIEDRVVKEQIKVLEKCVNNVIQELRKAESYADCSLNYAMTCQRDILDFQNRTLYNISQSLTESTSRAEVVISMAEKDLEQAREQMEEAERDVKRAEEEIEEAERERRDQEQKLKETRDLLQNAEKYVREWKQKATESRGARNAWTAGAALLAAPLIFTPPGALFYLGAAAVGGGLGMAINSESDAREYEKAIAQLKEGRSTLEKNVTTLRSNIKILGQNKSTFQRVLNQRKAAVSVASRTQTSMAKQVERAEELQENIGGMENRADAISSKADDLRSDLQEAKSKLSDCKMMIVQHQKSAAPAWLTTLGLRWGRRSLEERKALLDSLNTALSTVQAALPQLLMIEDMRRLE